MELMDRQGSGREDEELEDECPCCNCCCRGRRCRACIKSIKTQTLTNYQPLWTVQKIMIGCGATLILLIVLCFVISADQKNGQQQLHRYDNYSAECEVVDSDNASTLPRKCELTIQIQEDMKAPIYFYYELRNFHQNHRRYVRSLSWLQLAGINEEAEDKSDKFVNETKGSEWQDCFPVATYPHQSDTFDPSNEHPAIYPCGLIADTMVPDRFSLAYSSGTNCDKPGSSCPWTDHCPRCDFDALAATVEPAARLDEWNKWHDDGDGLWSQDGITWVNEPEKFVEPSNLAAAGVARTSELWQQYGMLKPKVSNLDFMNWMKTAAFPKFRKLFRIIKNQDLKKGEYVKITIANFFNIKKYDGEKWIVLQTVGNFGGRSVFLYWFFQFTALIVFFNMLWLAMFQKILPRKIDGALQSIL